MGNVAMSTQRPYLRPQTLGYRPPAPAAIMLQPSQFQSDGLT